MIPTIPAVMNAIYDAIGVRITSLPATPEKVLAAINAAAIKEKAARLEARGGLDWGTFVASDVAVATGRTGEKPFAADLVGHAGDEHGAARGASGRRQRRTGRGLDPAAEIRDRGRRRHPGHDAAHRVPGDLPGLHRHDRFRIGQGHARFLQPGQARAVLCRGNSPSSPRALDAARLIVLTHHHADHVAGVVTSPNFAALAAKTIITMDVADCLMNTPHRPHLKLTQQAIGTVHRARLSAALSGGAGHRTDPLARPQHRFADGLSSACNPDVRSCTASIPPG